MDPEIVTEVLATASKERSAARGKTLAASPPTPPPEMNISLEWSSKSQANQLHQSPPDPQTLVAVIGVGYVGTHLVEAFSQHYNVIAYDLSEKRLQAVAEQLKGLPIKFTSCATSLGEATHILISVPTVLNDDKTIDTTYLRSAIADVEKYARPGSTIVVESSVAVGMTRQLVGPLMQSKNFKVGMSPERVDPGRTTPSFITIPKIISGLDAPSLHAISALYTRVFASLRPVSSPEVAEMTKLYENCQRMVCAAYANEMADACAALGLDAWEVCAAAASKPFGYLPFRPGPGVGGHCIPVNPYYLLATCEMPLLESAARRSGERPAEVAGRFMRRVEEGRRGAKKAAKGGRARVLVVGVGFKRGQSVLSNSPGVGIIRALVGGWDVHVEFADPLVAQGEVPGAAKMDTATCWNEEYLGGFDGIVVAVDQVGLDMGVLGRLQGVIVQDYSGCLPSTLIAKNGEVKGVVRGKEGCPPRKKYAVGKVLGSAYGFVERRIWDFLRLPLPAH